MRLGGKTTRRDSLLSESFRRITPFSISTDLHDRNIAGPVFDLATTVSKVHAAGLPFEDCVAAIASRPRGFMGLEAGKDIAAGHLADFTVFDLVDCDEAVTDSMGNTARIQKMFEPRWTVLGSQANPASRGSAPPPE